MNILKYEKRVSQVGALFLLAGKGRQKDSTLKKFFVKKDSIVWYEI